MPRRTPPLTPFQTPPGYEGLQDPLDAFRQDHPEFENNVFIAMRFRDNKQYSEIHQAIKTGLGKYGLIGLRADDKTYPRDGDLWSNICVYMMGCKYGVCVFEAIDELEFNPNVPLEYGFMRAINRQVLLLKEKRMPKLPSDMTGKLYRTFDSYSITETIHQNIGEWAERDLGRSLIKQRPEVAELIDRLTANSVLILGRTTPKIKGLKDALTENGYDTEVFDLDKYPSSEHVQILTDLVQRSPFVVADQTDQTGTTAQDLASILPQPPFAALQPVMLSTALVRAVDFSPELLRSLQQDPTRLRSLTPDQFERFVADRIDRMGYNVTLTGASNRKDGGIDLIAVPKVSDVGSVVIAGQMKHHQGEQKTGRDAVDRLLAWKDSYFGVGLLVTNTSFTRDAVWTAQQERNARFLRLRDLTDLKRWLEDRFGEEESDMKRTK